MYVDLFHQQKTQTSHKTQISAMRKILTAIFWKKHFNDHITYTVTKFCFSSPLHIKATAYINNPCRTLKEGKHILYDGSKKAIHHFQIHKIWREHATQTNREVMLMAKHFSDFIKFDQIEQLSENQEEGKKKIKIVSPKATYFQHLFVTADKYQKQNKIDEWVISALQKLMNYNMVIITVCFKQILYIETKENFDIFSFLKQKKREAFYLKYEKDNWKVGENYDLYVDTKKIGSRGKIKILKSSDTVLQIDDIFIV